MTEKLDPRAEGARCAGPRRDHCGAGLVEMIPPQARALGSTQTVLAGPHGARLGRPPHSRGAKRRPGAPNKPAWRARSAGAARPCCRLLTVSWSVAGGGASG